MIRLARPEEVPALAQMMCEAGPWLHFGYTADECEQRLGAGARAHGARLYALEDRGAVLAFALVEPEGTFGGAWIDYVCVAPEHRGRGLGTYLLRYFIHGMFPHRSVYLTVSESNGEAKRLYRRLGFEVVGTLRDYNFAGEAEYLMRLHRGPKRDAYRG